MEFDFFIQNAATHPLYFFSVVFTVIFSIVLHELAHGWVAIRHGDRTPISSGHMTIDPWVHMGLWSVIALLLAGIAWGSMPIDRTRLRGRFAEAVVALAGPLTNLLLAVIALTALGVWMGVGSPEGSDAAQNAREFVTTFGATNLMLCVFNLLPVPPLDGSHILANLSRGYARFISDPAHGGVLMLMFAFTFVVSGAIVEPVMILGFRYVAWIAVMLGG